MQKITFSTVLLLVGTFFIYSQSLSRLETAPYEKRSLDIKGLYFNVSDAGNNSELSEIGCAVFREKYLITSNKKRGFARSYKNSETGMPNNNIFCSDILYNNNLDIPLVFSKILNSKHEQGGLTFNPEGNKIYFTRSKADDSQSFSLYKADLNVDSKYYWDNLEELSINDDSFSIETPFISKGDGSKIYFSSNKPGGYGGYDLYVAEVSKSGHIVKMKNLGPTINTDKDEKYPFMDEKGKYFYFSSNGYEGYGNYDVYRASVKEQTFTNVSNMGNSLNTPSDDVAFYLLDETNGYVSTNEIENKNDFNVYKFRMIEIAQKVTVDIVDLKDGKPLAGVNVLITDEYDEVVKRTTTDESGKIKYKGSLLKEYSIKIEKPNYVNQEDVFTLEHNNKGQNEHELLFKMKEYPLVAQIIDGDTKESVGESVVSIFNKDKELLGKFKTGAEGSFRLSDAPNAPFYISVENDGYYVSENIIENDLTNGSSMNKTLEVYKVEAEIVKDAVVVGNETFDVIAVEDIFFDFDKATIKEESKVTLHKVYNLLKAKNEMHIVINAHTDSNGSVGYNDKLSQVRALAVYNHLISEGISADRISYKAYGESKPLVKCADCTDEQDAKNRRVEFVIQK
ncbi:MAG: OmpA family protein [Flavobacteriales bacterium]|nr:OmpA family protein [Flavobacteriales bacterium]